MNQFEPCDAMRKAGITEPESQEGIDFCTENCPYPDGCFLDEPRYKTKRKTRAIAARAIRLAQSGYSEEDIARKLGKSLRQIQRYVGGQYGYLA